MQQVQDFLDECETLAALIDGQDVDWTAKTQFKDWTVEEVFIHLHFWNKAVDRAQNDPQEFAAQMNKVIPEMMATGLRPIENRTISERGQDIFDAWIAFSRDMAAR